MDTKPWELDSISFKAITETTNFLAKAFSFLSFLSSDPLFSSIVTLYTLILLYFPRLLLGIVFSPVLISTGILLLTLLRFGAIQRVVEKEINSIEPEEIDSQHEDRKWVECQADTDAETEMGFDPNPFFSNSFVEWNVRAPLEVIYEDYEGEDNDDVSNMKEETRFMGIERFPSLSLYYPESDTDSSSDGEFPGVNGWDSPENMCFRWDEEDRDGLIEITLDGKRSSGFQVEEENMIEIDISPAKTPARYAEFSGKCQIQLT